MGTMSLLSNPSGDGILFLMESASLASRCETLEMLPLIRASKTWGSYRSPKGAVKRNWGALRDFLWHD